MTYAAEPVSPSTGIMTCDPLKFQQTQQTECQNCIRLSIQPPKYPLFTIFSISLKSLLIVMISFPFPVRHDVWLMFFKWKLIKMDALLNQSIVLTFCNHQSNSFHYQLSHTGLSSNLSICSERPGPSVLQPLMAEDRTLNCQMNPKHLLIQSTGHWVSFLVGESFRAFQ